MPARFTGFPLLLAAVTVCVLTLHYSRAEDASDREDDSEATVYELRTYTTHDGRLPELHRRFRDHTMKIFARVGMKNVIYWTPTDRDNTLVYVLAHKSRKAADESWNAFRNDPEWKEVFAESRKNGPLVAKVEREFLTTTDYSPMK